jgi:hypothetical protein
MPGLIPVAPPAMAAARTVVRQKIDPETERLRAVLRATLAELESLRALLS